METVKIYESTCTKGVMMSDQRTGFTLDPWGEDTDMIQGYDDGGEDYILPDGYEVCELKYGGIGIFHGDHFCDIYTHSSGRPQLQSIDTHKMPVLQRAVLRG